MSPTETTVRPQADTLSLEWDLPHPPEKVWRALTEPALLSEWLLPIAELHLAPGATFAFQTQAYEHWDGRVDCRLLEIEPYRTLRYAWTVPFLDTVVTFTLAPTPSGTRLSLVQSGFAASQKREMGGARYGWTKMGGQLAALLGRLP